MTRVMRSRESVLAEFHDLMQGPDLGTLQAYADRMGMTRAALDKALEKARAAGDPRAVYGRRTGRGDRLQRRRQVVDAYRALPAGLTIGEAAKRLDMTRPALASLLSRARRTGLLEEDGLDDESVLEEWKHLSAGGVHWEHAADRLGLTRSAFSRILKTARNLEGDPS